MKCLLSLKRISFKMYRKQRTSKTRNEAYLGAVHGNMRRYPSYRRNERTLCPKERNNRASFWNGEREPWIQIHPDVWESPDGNESRAYLCVYEFKEASKNEAKNGADEELFLVLFMHRWKKN